MNKMNLKPSKPVSAGSIVGLIFMLLFGIGFAILVVNVLSENDAPLVMKIIFPLFMAGWIGTVLFMLVYHFLNLKRAKGLSMFDIETEAEGEKKTAAADFEIRLRKVESLKKDGLISKEEYDRKRDAIMKENW